MDLIKIIKTLYNFYLFLPLILTVYAFILGIHKFRNESDKFYDYLNIFMVGIISLPIIFLSFKFLVPFIVRDLAPGGFFYNLISITCKLTIITFSILGICMYEEYMVKKRIFILFIPVIMLFAFEIPKLITYSI
ncbi:hypothetical protein D4A35_08325 [Paraclostridium bifermentans]|uniref:Uncharacterized protein n=1 Tax=Paraclostridium bifermentans TaxID=1490 RepID=A0A5P3XF27_PARBF|nr:hypothetical protein [Paraclostridium bifermentans]QEZ68938.1 hypothetical protein D4A35_08325 [Paraclostridium bifermentans]